MSDTSKFTRIKLRVGMRKSGPRTLALAAHLEVLDGQVLEQRHGGLGSASRPRGGNRAAIRTGMPMRPLAHAETDPKGGQLVRGTPKLSIS